MKTKENLKKAAPGMPSAGAPTLDYSQWQKTTNDKKGAVMTQPKLSAQHLKTLQKAYQAKPAAPAWQQPAMTPKQERDYKAARAALINSATPVEILNEITSLGHPMFNYLTPEDHINAYKHLYRYSENIPDTDPAKAQAINAYQSHMAQARLKNP